MKTISIYILMVMVAVVVSWGPAPNEVQAMASPCEELASLDNEKERLEGRLAEAEEKVDEVEPLRRAAWEAFEERSIELMGFCCLAPHQILLQILALRAEGNDESADRWQFIYDEILPLWMEWMTRDTELGDWNEKVKELKESLDDLPDRRFALMEECGVIREMPDLISSFEHRVPSSVPSDPEMQNPMGSPANQASNETQYTIPFGVVQEEQPPQTAVGQVAMPGTETAAVTPARARLFNKLPEVSVPGVSQSAPAVTGQVMQIDQSGSSNTGTNSFGHTHMQLPQNAGRSGTVVPPQKTLRGIVRVRQMRLQPGRSIKR